MKKQIIGFLLCICMLAALLPLQAAAADETLVLVRENFGDDYTFESGKIYRICLNADDSYIVVEKGATLTVEPGAIIEFGVNGNVHDSADRNCGDRLYVRGALKLLGTAENPVTVRPQYTGDWANFTGIVLERDETGGAVSLEACYTSFTGGGMEGRAWMGGIISIHGHGEVEQSYSIKLDHCAVQGSSHPWNYPDELNSSDGTYALGFKPDLYGSGIYVSAEGIPVNVELNECTFGAEDAPLGTAIMDSDYTTSRCHDWTITNCTFSNCRDAASNAHNRLKAMVNIDAPNKMVVTGCAFHPTESLPIPLYYNDEVNFRAQTDEHRISDCELSFTASENTVYTTVYSVPYSKLPLCYSGVPLQELNVAYGTLLIPERTGDGLWGYAGYELCIADGGSINVSGEGKLEMDPSPSENRYYRMKLGTGVNVNGLALYESDGETEISCPTAEPMSFVYLSPYYNNDPYQGVPKGKWVRVEAHAPVTGVEIAEGEEVWITGGSNEWSALHAFVTPEDAYDDAAYWIGTNNSGSKIERELDYDKNLHCYKPGALRVRYTWQTPADEVFVAYSREDARTKTVTVHFRSPEEMTSVTGVSLNKREATLKVGQSDALTATVAPEDATTKNVWWESDDESVVRVDRNGVITALGEGTATVTVTTLDCPATAECTVTVTKNDTPAYDYFGLWMCDAEHNPNTGGSVVILYELDDGTYPPDSGQTWTSSTNQTVPAGTKVTLIAQMEPKYQFKGWYQANIDRANATDPYYLENKLVSTELTYTFVGNPCGQGESPYICAVFEYTGIERFADQIQVWVGNTDGRATDSSGMGGKVAVKYTPSEPNVYGLRTLDGTDFVAGEIVQFYKGDEITACAKPDEGYRFVGWYDVNIEWGPGNGKSYEGDVISTESSITYRPGVTVFPGHTEPQRYVCAVFEAVSTEQDVPCDGGKDCPSYAFRDVNYGDWYHEAVDFAVKRGLFKGMTDTTFEPNTAMTRGMLVTVLYRYDGEHKDGRNTFTDVKASDWFADAVAWAAEHGIVTGVGNNRFDPNGRITREQMAAILYRYSAYKNYDTDKRGNLNAFPDAAKVSSYAHDAYAWAVGEGLITGNKLGGQTLLDPQGNATRAQVATILMRFIEKIAK